MSAEFLDYNIEVDGEERGRIIGCTKQRYQCGERMAMHDDDLGVISFIHALVYIRIVNKWVINTNLHSGFPPNLSSVAKSLITNPNTVPLLQSWLIINIAVESCIQWYKCVVRHQVTVGRGTIAYSCRDLKCIQGWMVTRNRLQILRFRAYLPSTVKCTVSSHLLLTWDLKVLFFRTLLRNIRWKI